MKCKSLFAQIHLRIDTHCWRKYLLQISVFNLLKDDSFAPSLQEVKVLSICSYSKTVVF